MSLRPVKVTATLTDYVARMLHPRDHARRVARGMAELQDHDPGPGNLAEQPERLVTQWTVSYGEELDLSDQDGAVMRHELPARVIVTLAVPTGWIMEQVEAALRLLGERVHAASGAPGAPPVWDGVWRSRPGN